MTIIISFVLFIGSEYVLDTMLVLVVSAAEIQILVGTTLDFSVDIVHYLFINLNGRGFIRKKSPPLRYRLMLNILICQLTFQFADVFRCLNDLKEALRNQVIGQLESYVEALLSCPVLLNSKVNILILFMVLKMHSHKNSGSPAGRLDSAI